MFDLIDQALEIFDEIRGQFKRYDKCHSTERFENWIEDDVVCAVDDLLCRKEFRQAVSWWAKCLAPGTKDEARDRVEALDAALIAEARTLSNWANQLASRTALENGESHIGDCAPGAMSTENLLCSVEFIASRPWRDLVSLDDFFGPLAGLNLKDPGSGPRNPTEFVPFLHRELSEPGDHVGGMALRRAGYFRSFLSEFRSRCTQAASLAGPTMGLRPPLHETSTQLTEATERLKNLLTLTPQARLRIACVSLVQIRAEFSPNPDLSWIGLDKRIVPRGCFRFWLTNHRKRGVATRVALALGTVSSVYRQPWSPEETVAECVRSHKLVVVDRVGAPAIFWEGKEVRSLEGMPTLAQAFTRLAMCAQRGARMDSSMFDLARPDDDFKPDGRLAIWICRMKDELPESLADLTTHGKKGGVYELDVPKNEIVVLRVDDGMVAIYSGLGTWQTLRAPLN